MSSYHPGIPPPGLVTVARLNQELKAHKFQQLNQAKPATKTITHLKVLPQLSKPQPSVYTHSEKIDSDKSYKDAVLHMCKIFVSNLPEKPSREELERIFLSFGPVNSVNFGTYAGGRPDLSLYACVALETADAADLALQHAANLVLRGKCLKVNCNLKCNSSPIKDTIKKIKAEALPLHRVYVSNPVEIAETELRDIFGMCGTVISISMAKGFAYVEYNSAKSVTDALAYVNLRYAKDHCLKVTKSVVPRRVLDWLPAYIWKPPTVVAQFSAPVAREHHGVVAQSELTQPALQSTKASSSQSAAPHSVDPETAGKVSVIEDEVENIELTSSEPPELKKVTDLAKKALKEEGYFREISTEALAITRHFGKNFMIRNGLLKQTSDKEGTWEVPWWNPSLDHWQEEVNRRRQEFSELGEALELDIEENVEVVVEVKKELLKADKERERAENLAKIRFLKEKSVIRHVLFSYISGVQSDFDPKKGESVLNEQLMACEEDEA